MIISERETDTHLYFLRGVLSNFEKCYIKYKGHLFATTEQAFMWEKAVFFNDHESASKILREENPAKAKKLGREVKNFDDSKWSKVCYEIMYLINYEKYFQNTHLKNILLNTGDKMIIEANPKDTRWGIGLSAKDDRVLDESQWQGENLLGKVLMELRKDLK